MKNAIGNSRAGIIMNVVNCCPENYILHYAEYLAFIEYTIYMESEISSFSS